MTSERLSGGTADQDAESSAAVGRELRQLRRAAGLTIEHLAERAGVSSGFVSQLELGRANPSLGNLQKLARALGLPLVRLLGSPQASTPLTEGLCWVTRPGRRKRLALSDEHIVYELLTPDLHRSLEVVRSLIPSDYDTSAVPYVHGGEECVYVVRGRIEAHVGAILYTLEAGDAITFDAHLPHWWRSAGDEEGELIGAVSHRPVWTHRPLRVDGSH